LEFATAAIEAELTTEMYKHIDDSFAKEMATVEKNLRARKVYLDNKLAEAYPS
jgi:hypothetical protein